MLHVSEDARELDEPLARLRADGGRVLGLSGAPGAGKSTLAALLAARTGAVVVPMDGFHLADVELDRRGLRDRKGTPGTFDAEGYAALLRRVRAREEIVMAPSFERDLEQPLAGAVAVPGTADLVVTEGSYLLLEEPRWRAVREQLDAVWHVVTDDVLRRERLLERHVRHGKDPDAARAWIAAVDDPDARLVGAAADRADLLVDLTRLRPA